MATFHAGKPSSSALFLSQYPILLENGHVLLENGYVLLENSHVSLQIIKPGFYLVEPYVDQLKAFTQVMADRSGINCEVSNSVGGRFLLFFYLFIHAVQIDLRWIRLNP